MRMIDADALVDMMQKTICDYCRDQEHLGCASCYLDDVVSLIEQAPTADRVERDPVKPKETDKEIRIEYACGMCGHQVGLQSKIQNDLHYRDKFCPMCGREVDWR